jgi:hypothetical protein
MARLQLRQAGNDELTGDRHRQLDAHAPAQSAWPLKQRTDLLGVVEKRWRALQQHQALGVDAGPTAAPTRRQVELAFTTPTATRDGGLRAVRGLAPPKPPTDKRAAPGARAPQELEILGYAFEALEEDVRECLSQWDALDAGATGEVLG